VRVRNSDIQKGKRSGYRLIYHLRAPTNIILVTVYSKLDQADISAEQIRRILIEFDKHLA
jgi:mRNA-degrading endonuclease RelE of RelBE toxin-antitoxin system